LILERDLGKMTSQHAMPLIIANLGVEMIYVLNQRLEAQKVPKEKHDKGTTTRFDPTCARSLNKHQTVLDDIVCAMFAKTFVNEFMIPQDPYSGTQVHELFKKVAHASIMKLNDHSMLKLFELMIMTFKYQFMRCTQPEDILNVTSTHFKGIRKILVPDSVSIALVKSVEKRVQECYENLTISDWQDLKETLYAFFYDRRVRISILLKSKEQNSDGTMSLRFDGPVSERTEFPGIVKYTNKFGDERIETLSALSIRHVASPKRDEDIPEWTKKLGTNMYDDQDMDVLGAVCEDSTISEDNSRSQSVAAKAALSLLGEIIRDRKTSSSSSSSSSRTKPIMIDFDDSVRFLRNSSRDGSSKFEDDDEEEVTSLNISASSDKYRKNVKKYRDVFGDDDDDDTSSKRPGGGTTKNDDDYDDDDDDDLLAMMDSACGK